MLERAICELRTKPKAGNEGQRTRARHDESHSVPSPPEAKPKGPRTPRRRGPPRRQEPPRPRSSSASPSHAGTGNTRGDPQGSLGQPSLVSVRHCRHQHFPGPPLASRPGMGYNLHAPAGFCAAAQAPPAIFRQNGPTHHTATLPEAFVARHSYVSLPVLCRTSHFQFSAVALSLAALVRCFALAACLAADLPHGMGARSRLSPVHSVSTNAGARRCSLSARLPPPPPFTACSYAYPNLSADKAHE